ncbi:GNAT family N-acetyltransferase [Anaerolineales bacterium HSG24]|nr:GNAT family N-acetyltransferase [Anaerolineales bacterium HSG24]
MIDQTMYPTEIEEILANAWPAIINQVIDGWHLRFSDGVTGRANSVWPMQAGNPARLTEKLALVKRFYHGFNHPVQYRICTIPHQLELDTHLAGLGYAQIKPTDVQTVSLSTLLNKLTPNPNYACQLVEGFSPTWFESHCQLEGYTGHVVEARRSILQRIVPRSGYFSILVDGQPIAVGMTVLERGWIGLFSLFTHPDFRRQGVGQTLLHALTQWGKQYGAQGIYLQVMENNQEAQAFYRHLGFETLYRYSYRVDGGG